jgi:hypothetical protein
MKYILILFVCFVFAFNSFAQSYKIERKEIKKENKKPKWELELIYSELGGNPGAGQDGYNRLIKQLMNAEKDTFAVWMKDWEVSKDAPKDMGSYYDVWDTIWTLDQKLVSTQFSVESYFLGAAHPNHDSYSVNYDLEQGKEIKLNDLFTGDYLKFLSDYCIKEVLKQQREFDSTLTKPDETLLEGAGPKEENFKVFNFLAEGFQITFPTYQVGSYAEGPHDVLIPYALLKDYVKKGSHLERFVK